MQYLCTFAFLAIIMVIGLMAYSWETRDVDVKLDDVVGSLS